MYKLLDVLSKITKLWHAFFCGEIGFFSERNTSQDRYVKLFFGGMLVVIVALLYGQFLSIPFSYDATDNFTKQMLNDMYPGFSLAGFFTSQRFLTWMSFAVNYDLTGFDVVWFNAVNYTLHAANSVLIFLFTLKFIQYFTAEFKMSGRTQVIAAFFAALFFAVHPVSVFNAAYAVQRFLLMATFFSLLTLLIYFRGLTSQKSFSSLWAMIPFFLALQSKEQASVLVLVLVVLTFLAGGFEKSRLRKSIVALMPFFLFSIYAVLRTRGILFKPYEQYAALALRAAQGGETTAPHGMYLASVVNQMGLFCKYLTLWVWPDNARMAIDMPLEFLTESQIMPLIFGAVLFLAYVMLTFVLLFRKNFWRLVGFFMFVPLALFCTEFATVRYHEIFVVYRSYIWFCFFALPTIFLWRSVTASKLTVFTLIAIFLSCQSLERLKLFNNPVALWEEAANLSLAQEKIGASGYRLFGNLGTALGNQKRYKEAVMAYQKSATLNPYYAKAWDGIGASLYFDGEKNAAIPYFKKAIETNPNYAPAYYNLGTLFSELKLYKEAVETLTKAVQIDPKFAIAWFNLGNAWLNLGGNQRARYSFDRVIELEPSNKTAWKNAAVALERLGNADEAKIYLEKSK